MADIEITVEGSPAPALAATASLYTLQPLATIRLPGCPENMLLSALRLAAREFCRETGIWRETLTTVTIADEDEYDVNALHGYDAVVERVLAVRIEDVEQAPAERTYGPTGVLTFDNAPTEDGDALEVDAELLPRISCATYPSWLLSTWAEGIVARAVAMLKAVPRVPYSDPDGAAAAMDEYRYAAGRAKETLLIGREDGDISVKLREWM